MKRIISLSTLLFSFCLVCYAQPREKTLKDSLNDVLKDIISIKEKFKEIDAIKLENEKLKSSIWEKDKIEYEKKLTMVQLANEHSLYIANKFTEIQNHIQIDKALLALTNTQNISKNNFQKVLITEATNMFTSSKEPERTAVWKSIVGKIVNNDLLSSILKSNPVGVLVNSVITTASSFINNEVSKLPKTKEYILTAKEAIDSTKIEKFKRSMKVYIDFFEKLATTNDKFYNALSDLEIKYHISEDSIKGYNNELNNLLKIDANSSKTSAMNILFQHSKSGSVNYNTDFNFFTDILGKKEVIKLVSHASKWDKYKYHTDLFAAEYRATIVSFMKSYDNLFIKEVNENNKIKELFSPEDLDKIRKAIDNAINAHQIESKELGYKN